MRRFNLFLFFFVFTKSCICTQYKVGDLDSWGIPPSSKPDIYSVWSQAHDFHLGDSLLFLYPPSEDSVIQVTIRAYEKCTISNPILALNDGNSVFNLTSPGQLYFISGIPAHCQKNQKLTIKVPMANGTFLAPPPDVEPPAMVPAGSPMYPVVFGPSAAQSSDGIAIRVSDFVGFGIVLLTTTFVQVLI